MLKMVNGSGAGSREGTVHDSGVPIIGQTTRTQAMFGKYLGERNMNVGCGRNLEPGFYNTDRRPSEMKVTTWDMEHTPCPMIPGLPYEQLVVGDRLRSECIDSILASQVLEHITNLIPLMREFHRILKPNGYLIISVPYASSDDAWEDPTHVRSFTERSWAYFDRRLYAAPNHAGSYISDVDFIFEAVEVGLNPTEWAARTVADLERAGQKGVMDFIKQHQRNVIREMVAVLRKVEE